MSVETCYNVQAGHAPGFAALCNGRLATAPGSAALCNGRLATAPGSAALCNGRLAAAPGSVALCNGRLATAPGSVACNNGRLACAAADVARCAGAAGSGLAIGACGDQPGGTGAKGGTGLMWHLGGDYRVHASCIQWFCTSLRNADLTTGPAFHGQPDFIITSPPLLHIAGRYSATGKGKGGRQVFGTCPLFTPQRAW